MLFVLNRKKLKLEFGHQYPSISDSELASLFTSKDEMSVMKIVTHSGVDVMVYVSQKNPVLFQVDKSLYPTVYLLWRFPELIPRLTTWREVFKKLHDGADLMLPGVKVPEPPGLTALGTFQKNETCSVALDGNGAAVAVGYTTMSSSEMYEAGMRGKGVSILHTFGDKLWAFGDRSYLPLIPEASPSSYPNYSDEENNRNPEGGVSTQNDGSVVHEETSVELTTEHMGRLLYVCFMCALKKNVPPLEPPLLTSGFFRNHMVPCCPDEVHLDVKKSSYKKLSVFLAVMEEFGFIKVQIKKGNHSIVSVDRGHSCLRAFQIPEWALAADGFALNLNYTPPTVVPLYRVTPEFEPLLPDYRMGDTAEASDIRKQLTKYVKKNQLSEGGARLVRLDAALQKVLVHGNCVRWDELMKGCMDKMTPVHRVTFPGEEPRIHHKWTPVQLDVLHPLSTHKTTVVSNLEPYRIESSELACLVKKVVGCGTSIQRGHRNPKISRILVQGNQIHRIGKLLTDEYKLPKKLISGLEKAPKEKK